MGCETMEYMNKLMLLFGILFVLCVGIAEIYRRKGMANMTESSKSVPPHNIIFFQEIDIGNKEKLNSMFTVSNYEKIDLPYTFIKHSFWIADSPNITTIYRWLEIPYGLRK